MNMGSRTRKNPAVQAMGMLLMFNLLKLAAGGLGFIGGGGGGAGEGGFLFRGSASRDGSSSTVAAGHLDHVLTDGGDDRTTINANGVNKYHCRPQPLAGAIFRGSCTCNIPTEGAYEAAKTALESIQAGEASVADTMEGIRSRIKSLYKLPGGVEVILCPSGSDAEYIPLQIAKILNKGRKIVNIITCVSEVGSGTVNAAGGKMFSPVAPLPVEGVEFAMGMPLEGLADNVETVSIDARDLSDSSVVDARKAVQEAVDRCAAEGSVPIVHSVLGSKTGIVQPFPQADFGKMEPTRDAFVVIDACQARFKKAHLHELLEKGAFVLITGSKFYRGPPFSGAVLIPSQIMEQLRLSPGQPLIAPGLGYFLSSSELPKELSSWKVQLGGSENTGLALRWVAALDEMESTLSIHDDEKDAVTHAWIEGVIKLVDQYKDELETFEPRSCPTILSIRCRKPAGGYYTNGECKKIFEWMTLDMSEKLGTADGAPLCYIGQPVNVGKGGECVLRIALGSDSLRLVRDNSGAALAEDTAVVKKLALLIRNYDSLA